jgi:hypothetical protein
MQDAGPAPPSVDEPEPKRKGITLAEFAAREMARPDAIVTHHPADELGEPPEYDEDWSDEQWARYFLEDREDALIAIELGRFPVHEAWVDRPDEYLRVSRENLAQEAHEFRREIAQIEARRSGYVEISYQSAPVRSVNRQHHGRAPRRATNGRSTGSRRSSPSSRTASADPGGGDPDSSEGDGDGAGRPHLHLVPDLPARPARYAYGILTAAERGAEVEAVAS